MSFDHLAPIYRALEGLAFGNTLDRAREHFASDLQPCHRILLAGEGTGRFLKVLTKINTEGRIDCVDSSAAMLRQASDRLEAKSLVRVEFIQADLLHWKPKNCYDALVTNFFLDCFDEYDQRFVVEKLAQAASSDAKWFIAEFAIPKNRFAALLGRVVIGLMYLFFRVTTNLDASELVDYRPALKSSGFTRTKHASRLGGLVISEVWQRSQHATLFDVGFGSAGAANPAK